MDVGEEFGIYFKMKGGGGGGGGWLVGLGMRREI